MNPRRPTTGCALLVLLAGCATAAGRPGPAAPRSPPPALDAPVAREVLVRFAALVEAADFERAFPLLAARWRERSSPARLARDHAGAGPAAREVVGRVRRVGATAAVALASDGAHVALGDGREALLVAEGGVWRVDALERLDPEKRGGAR